MEDENENISCHICMESEVSESPDFKCQTENCHFLICDDCKQQYFVDQQQKICPGCRQQSIDLNILSKYSIVQKIPSREQKLFQKLIKRFKIIMYITVITVIAYWIGVIVLYTCYGTRTQLAIIILRILIGYFILFLMSVCLSFLCLLHL